MLKAVVLTDNHPGSLTGEWGLSVYIEFNGARILLDAGASGLFAQNARDLELDPANVDLAVLSHAHYDHADGLERFFALNDHAKLYLRASCKEDCWAMKNGVMEYIGLPLGFTERYADRLVSVDGDPEILPGVTLLSNKNPHSAAIGQKEHLYRLPAADPACEAALASRTAGRPGFSTDGTVPACFVPDDFSHEQSLIFHTQQGLVIFNSCCHAGAANVITAVAQAFPSEPLLALIGGFHLYQTPDEEVLALAEQIRATGIRTVVTGHCTGDRALELLSSALGPALVPLYAGCVLSF